MIKCQWLIIKNNICLRWTASVWCTRSWMKLIKLWWRRLTGILAWLVAVVGSHADAHIEVLTEEQQDPADEGQVQVSCKQPPVTSQHPAITVQSSVILEDRLVTSRSMLLTDMYRSGTRTTKTILHELPIAGLEFMLGLGFRSRFHEAHPALHD